MMYILGVASGLGLAVVLDVVAAKMWAKLDVKLSQKESPWQQRIRP
jgi:hypothetical protein